MFKRLTQLISNPEVLEWIGSGLAIIGAILIALNIKLELIAFSIYLISNLFLLAFSYKKKHRGLLIMTATFVIINLIGIIRWF